MYKFYVSGSDRADNFYVRDINDADKILSVLLNVKVLSVWHAYKRCGMYWTLDLCRLTNNKYETFKQQSKRWLTRTV